LWVEPQKPIPLAEITCHACGKTGHYRGSKECPKTPSSAQIHALGFGAELGEETSPDGHDEEEEIPFEGLKFNGDADVEFTDFEVMIILAQEPSSQTSTSLVKVAMKLT
jgi:hypothetical protein